MVNFFLQKQQDDYYWIQICYYLGDGEQGGY